jgi:hypothetical protein
MTKINNSVLTVNGTKVNGITSSNTVTISNATTPLNGTIIDSSATFYPLNFDPVHIDKVWSVGSRSLSAQNASEIESITDIQWMTLLRKHIKLFVTDKELTDFLMEDSLKEK